MGLRTWLQKTLSFNFQIFGDGVRADFVGSGFDDEDALLTKLREGDAAAFEHFLRGG